MNTEALQGHTPGPWLAREMVSGNWQVAADDTAQTIAHIRSEADARLVAAAPDMLMALRNVIALAEHPVTQAEAMRLARAAIAKAQGHA
jgi:hypothetical protein